MLLTTMVGAVDLSNDTTKEKEERTSMIFNENTISELEIKDDLFHRFIIDDLPSKGIINEPVLSILLRDDEHQIVDIYIAVHGQEEFISITSLSIHYHSILNHRNPMVNVQLLLSHEKLRVTSFEYLPYSYFFV